MTPSIPLASIPADAHQYGPLAADHAASTFWTADNGCRWRQDAAGDAVYVLGHGDDIPQPVRTGGRIARGWIVVYLHAFTCPDPTDRGCGCAGSLYAASVPEGTRSALPVTQYALAEPEVQP